MFLATHQAGFGAGAGSVGPLVLVGAPTLELRAENNNGTAWTNLGSLGATGDFSGTSSAGAADSNFNGQFSARFTAGSSNTMTSGALLSQIITNSAMTGLIVARWATVNGDAPPITSANGAALFTDAGGFVTTGTATDFHFESFDGAGDEISTAVSANATYGLQFQHAGGELTLLRSGASAATPVTSGNVSDLTNTLQIGRQGASTKYFDGWIALIAIWNTALSSTDLETNRNNTATFFGFTW